jgi:ribonucleotide monophosphatase NagD (HAD superfamily)
VRARGDEAGRRRTLVVGDDLSLEIVLARRTGARTALVLTGISGAAGVASRPAERRPDTVVTSVAELPFA